MNYIQTTTASAAIHAALAQVWTGYTITAGDVALELEEMEQRMNGHRLAELNPETLALSIIDAINEAGILEVVYEAVRGAVARELINRDLENAVSEDEGWQEVVMNMSDSEMLSQMLACGRTQEAAHG